MSKARSPEAAPLIDINIKYVCFGAIVARNRNLLYNCKSTKPIMYNFTLRKRKHQENVFK